MPDLHVLVGQPLEVPLRDNSASTGHRWTLAEFPHCLLLEDVDYVAPPGPPVPGRSGKRIFTFIATKLGRGDIRFVLIRPWSPSQPISTVTYHVYVVGTEQPTAVTDQIR